MSSILYSYFDLFCRGLYDAVRNAFNVFTINEDFSSETSRKTSTKLHPHQVRSKKPRASASETERVKRNLSLLCLFNGGILLCGMLGFNYLFLPFFRRLFYFLAGGDPTSSSSSSSFSSRPLIFIQHFLTYTFNFLWLIPAFIISKFVNSYWFRDIADVVYRKLTSQTRSHQTLDFSHSISDVLFSLVMQIFFLIQSTVILLVPVPILNTLFGHFCLCLLYSFYAFEYAWIYGNLGVKERIERIQSYWPYYLGFGLPLTLISTQLFQSMIVNECIFSILFPFAIVAATSANFEERVAKPAKQIHIAKLNLFTGCIRLTSRLFSLFRAEPVKKSKTVSSSMEH